MNFAETDWVMQLSYLRGEKQLQQQQVALVKEKIPNKGLPFKQTEM